jgi:NTE family protein
MPDASSSVPRPLIGLALGAGVARGWAHIGVLRALAAHGIVPDIVAGCSIGALVGGVHLAGRLDELENWARRLSRMRIVGYLDLRVRAGGLIGGHRLVAELRRHLGPLTIESFETPFAAIATDLVSGHEVWLRKGDLVDAVRASFSLPGVFAPVQIGHRWLVDGALVNPIPVSACRALGADVVIAVNLNADIIGKARKHRNDVPVGEVPDLFTLLEGESPRKPSRFDALSRRVFQRNYDGPSLFGVMVSSLGIIQDRISRSRMAGEPPDVHVAPRLGHIGLLEFDRAAEAIAEGEASLLRALPDLQDAITVFMRQYAR